MSPSDRPLTIAFADFCTSAWIAGCHYLKNLFTALKSLDQPPQIVLLTAHQPPDDSYKMLLPLIDRQLTISLSRPLVERVRFFIQRKTHYDLKAGSPIAYFLRSQGIDAIFTLGKDYGEWFNVPLLAWYTDFQHIRLPEMFSREEIDIRTQGLRTVAHFADRVVLSSHDALNDFCTLLPEAAPKGRVVQFVSQVPTTIFDRDPRWVCDRYSLPEKFIYLPNQFWKHKNHLTAIKGLGLALAQRPDMTIVCTGNTHDYRDPLYFPQTVLPLLAEMGLQDRFRILGMVSHEGVFALIRQSIAVLQPSFFEGWSSTVEETKSIGKRMILSDIPVHREQNPPQSVFFPPDSPEALAACLRGVWDESAPGPDLALEAQAREQFPVRLRTFGQTFVDVVREVVP